MSGSLVESEAQGGAGLMSNHTVERTETASSEVPAAHRHHSYKAGGDVENLRVDKTIELYDNLERQLSRFAGRASVIENVILAISITTSGALWLLAAQVLPQATAWAGAAFSTLTTGLTLYLYSSGVNKKRQKAISLHAEISRFLARIRGNTGMSEEEFWDTYKALETQVRTLSFEHD
jgi:hypothetical protein